MRPTVLLADDHAMVADGLGRLVGDVGVLVGQVNDGVRLCDEVRRLRPDIVVADVTMPGMSGLEALRRLKAGAIAAKVIFLTMHADAQLAAEAFRAGASGFVVKHAAGRELISAIHAVIRGGRYLSPSLSSDVLTTLVEGGISGAGPLTSRQREVVALIAEGRTMKEVAAALNLSPRTVEKHKYQIMEALGLGSTAELIRYAVARGLTTPPARS